VQELAAKKENRESPTTVCGIENKQLGKAREGGDSKRQVLALQNKGVSWAIKKIFKLLKERRKQGTFYSRRGGTSTSQEGEPGVAGSHFS